MSESQIIAIPQNDLLAVSGGDDFLAIAEKRINQLQRIKELSLKITNENDWVDQNGKPYMMASGAEKVRGLFSISVRMEDPRKQASVDDRGDFYFYVIKGFASLKGGDSIEAVGTCSSRDSFFSKEDRKSVV